MRIPVVLILMAISPLLVAGAQAADVEHGAQVFKKCVTCHAVGPDAKAKVGPPLNGLMGRKSGTYEGYSYTDANKNSGIVWDDAVFAKYIKDPKGVIPGTKMSFAGLKDETDINDLLAFLKQYKADGSK
jgi:cytochrome c